MNQSVQTLIDLYRGGDKSVLPILLNFAYLTDFYDEALLSDPQGFLTAIKQLPKEKQRSVALGIAGGPFKPLEKAQFEAVRNVLAKVRDSSSLASIADECLTVLETNNASLFVEYFPPQTFTSRAAPFQIFWYARDLYSMGEEPLWPPSSDDPTYRFTYLGAFSGPKTVSLTILPDGTATIRTKALNPARDRLETDTVASVSPEKIAKFLTLINQSDFWALPNEEERLGLDGADWILEGRAGGKYHVVVRWCPAYKPRSANALAFANAGRLLLELAGQKIMGDC